MKRSLFCGTVLLALLVLGCQTNPAAAPVPGPAGPQTGQSGQSGDPGASGQTGATGQAGDQGQPGETGQTGDQGRQGQAAPCPAGEHKYTNPDNGRTICVRD
jgi:hypothetical protein